jgi:uncharacterized membrane-anchored protein
MAKNTSDKSLVSKVLIGCLLIMIGWQWAFAHFSVADYSSPVYLTILGIVLALFGYSVYNAYKQADSGTKDNSSRGWVIGIAVVILLFIAIWAAAANESVKPGSPQLEDIR